VTRVATGLAGDGFSGVGWVRSILPYKRNHNGNDGAQKNVTGWRGVTGCDGMDRDE